MAYWKCKSCSHRNENHREHCRRCNANGGNGWTEEEVNTVFEDHHHDDHDHDHDAAVDQGFDQLSIVEQESDELIWIKNSCNITVESTDTQGAVSLQVGLQLAIALVVTISIGDSENGREVAQEIFQKFDDEQTNKQKIYIDNSKDVCIKTTDTDLTANIQGLLEVLLSIVVKLDVL